MWSLTNNFNRKVEVADMFLLESIPDVPFCYQRSMEVMDINYRYYRITYYSVVLYISCTAW